MIEAVEINGKWHGTGNFGTSTSLAIGAACLVIAVSLFAWSMRHRGIRKRRLARLRWMIRQRR